MQNRIVTLHEYSAWNRGNHVQACINLLKGMVEHGGEVHLDLPRTRVDMGDIPYRASIPWPINRFGLPRLEESLRRMAERRFLRRLKDGDIAWLWPDVPLNIFEEVRQRGNPIVLEVINTRVASARRVLSEVHAVEGLPPPGKLTKEKVQYDEACLAFADYAFAASPAIESSLSAPESSFQGRILPTSYGAWTQSEADVQRSADGPVTLLFVGTLCLRKNVHGLLRAWSAAETGDARLVLIGPLTPEIETICAAELKLPSVDLHPTFIHPLDPFFREADAFVLPSLEEGDPQVTYEAAAFGLPIIASAMGGGRMADRTDAVFEVDPWDHGSMVDALTRFTRETALREDYGDRVKAAAAQFDWSIVGGQRLELLNGLDRV